MVNAQTCNSFVLELRLIKTKTKVNLSNIFYPAKLDKNYRNRVPKLVSNWKESKKIGADLAINGFFPTSIFGKVFTLCYDLLVTIVWLTLTQLTY